MNKDPFFKVFAQARYDITRGLASPMLKLECETIQLLCVWNFSPPFSSLHLAYREEPARFPTNS